MSPGVKKKAVLNVDALSDRLQAATAGAGGSGPDVQTMMDQAVLRYLTELEKTTESDSSDDEVSGKKARRALRAVREFLSRSWRGDRVSANYEKGFMEQLCAWRPARHGPIQIGAET